MATLITGGGSQTGLQLAALLCEAGRPVIFASRSASRLPADIPSVKFDWDDPSTFEAPFALGQQIDYVYLLGPRALNPLPQVQPFIDLVATKGVKRIVLLSGAGSILDAGPESFSTGNVHTYLREKGFDYVALRPTWFAENLSQFYGQAVKETSLIENVVERGPVAFIAVEDIAKTAFKAITDVESLHTREPHLIGPEKVSFQDVAAILTDILGREVKYNVISVEEKIRRLRAIGIQEQYACILANLEKELDDAFDLKVAANPKALLGKVGVKEWLEKNKAAFA